MYELDYLDIVTAVDLRRIKQMSYNEIRGALYTHTVPSLVIDWLIFHIEITFEGKIVTRRVVLKTLTNFFYIVLANYQ